MIEVAVYRIKCGVLLDAVKETVSSRLNTQSVMVDFCKKYGAQDYHLEGVDSQHIGGLRFAEGKIVPAVWERKNVDSCIYTPIGDVACEMGAIPNLPDEIDIITRLIDVPLFARLEKEGITSSELFDGYVPFVGFLHAGMDNDTFALWVPDVIANIKSWENKGYRVLDGLKNWEMQVDGLEKISMREWNELSNKHAPID
jgi:hypothetical protein